MSPGTALREHGPPLRRADVRRIDGCLPGAVHTLLRDDRPELFRRDIHVWRSAGIALTSLSDLPPELLRRRSVSTDLYPLNAGYDL